MPWRSFTTDVSSIPVDTNRLGRVNLLDDSAKMFGRVTIVEKILIKRQFFVLSEIEKIAE